MKICLGIGIILLIIIVATIAFCFIIEWHNRYVMRQAVKQVKAMYAMRVAKERLKK